LLVIVFSEDKKRLLKYLLLRQQLTGLQKQNVYFHIKKKNRRPFSPVTILFTGSAFHQHEANSEI